MNEDEDNIYIIEELLDTLNEPFQADKLLKSPFVPIFFKRVIGKMKNAKNRNILIDCLNRTTKICDNFFVMQCFLAFCIDFFVVKRECTDMSATIPPTKPAIPETNPINKNDANKEAIELNESPNLNLCVSFLLNYDIKQHFTELMYLACSSTTRRLSPELTIFVHVLKEFVQTCAGKYFAGFFVVPKINNEEEKEIEEISCKLSDEHAIELDKKHIHLLNVQPKNTYDNIEEFANGNIDKQFVRNEDMSISVLDLSATENEENKEMKHDSLQNITDNATNEENSLQNSYEEITHDSLQNSYEPYETYTDFIDSNEKNYEEEVNSKNIHASSENRNNDNNENANNSDPYILNLPHTWIHDEDIIYNPQNEQNQHAFCENVFEINIDKNRKRSKKKDNEKEEKLAMLSSQESLNLNHFFENAYAGPALK